MRAAEESAFREFVISESPSLLRLGFLLSSDWGAAEDLLQTALFQVYGAWHRIRLQDPGPFARRVMINAHISSRRRRRLREVPLHASDTNVGAVEQDTVDASLIVAGILSTLPPRQRAVIALRYCEDLSEADVAALLGCSTGTVKSQASKALRSLRGHPQVRSLCGLAEEMP